MVVGQHVGGVDPGEGLELAVLQQAGGTHRQRVPDLVQEGLQIAVDGRRQLGLQELVDDLLVVGVAQGDLAQIIPGLMKVSKTSVPTTAVGRHLDHGARETVVHAVAVEDGVHEGQAAALAAQGPAADAHEGAAGVEMAAGKIGHHAALGSRPGSG